VFRAVAVPEGVHEVSFRYVPRLVYASAGVSAASVAALLVLLVLREPAPCVPASAGGEGRAA
jgi:hypothetical protein